MLDYPCWIIHVGLSKLDLGLDLELDLDLISNRTIRTNEQRTTDSKRLIRLVENQHYDVLYKGPGNQHVESICPFLLAWFGNSRFAQQQQPPKSNRSTMTEPDELYTLRAQFWLGHYQMAADEAKSIMRRPMSPALKAEREEFVLRSLIAMGQFDKVISSSPDTPGTYIFT